MIHESVKISILSLFFMCGVRECSDFILLHVAVQFSQHHLLKRLSFPCYLFLSPVLCLVAQSCLTLCDPIDCSPLGSSVHQDSPGKNTGVGCHVLLRGSSQPRSPTLQMESLPSESPGKPFLSPISWIN